jgi:hypothetical protein
MNWNLILLLSTVGILMGACSVLGFTRGIEGALWPVLGIFCALVVGRNASQRAFLHGFAVGVLAGTVAPLIQSAFFTAYLAANPETSGQLAASGPSNARLLFLGMAVPIGLASGVVLGVLSWVSGKIVGGTG